MKLVPNVYAGLDLLWALACSLNEEIAALSDLVKQFRRLNMPGRETTTDENAASRSKSSSSSLQLLQQQKKACATNTKLERKYLEAQIKTDMLFYYAQNSIYLKPHVD